MADDFTLSDDDRAAILAQLRQAMGRGVRIPNEQLPNVLQLAEGTYTGLLVALWLDDVTAAALAQPGGEQAENLHITLAIVLDMAEADDLTFARIVAAIDGEAAWTAPLAGSIGGHGRFFGGNEGDVIYAAPDVPGLSELRQRIVWSLESSGAKTSSEHGFTPHITLAYVPSGEELTPELTELNLRFTDIVVVAGVRRVVIPLRGQPEGTVYAEPTSEHAGVRLVRPRTFTAASEWVQFLPAPGKYTHATFGSLDFTPEKYAAIVENFAGNVYGQDLPNNVEHDYRSAGAVGWIREMRLADDGSIEVRPEWNERGRSLIDEDRFRYVSAENYDQWQDPVTGAFHDNVAVGMAICVRPHFKTDVLRPLVASETGALDQAGGATAHRQEGTGMPDDAKHQQPPAAEPAVTLTEAEVKEYRELKPKYDETVRELTEAKATILSQTGRIDALETAQRTQRFTNLVKGVDGGPRWFAELADHVAMLNDLAVQFGEESEQIDRYIATNTKYATSVAQAGLFTATGTGAGGDESKTALDQLNDKAKAFAEVNGVTFQQAFARVLESDHDLAAAYSRERRRTADVTGAEAWPAHERGQATNEGAEAMAWEVDGVVKLVGYTAGADLSGKQHHFVKVGANKTVVACAALTDVPIGVLQNRPAQGRAAEVTVIGVTKIVGDEDLSLGDLIGPSADGQADKRVIGTDTTHYVVGQVLEENTAAGGMVTAVINCAAPGRAA